VKQIEELDLLDQLDGNEIAALLTVARNDGKGMRSEEGTAVYW